VQGGNGSDHIYGDSGAEYGLWGGASVAGTYPDNSDDYVHGGGGADKIIGGQAQGAWTASTGTQATTPSTLLSGRARTPMSR
jgi:hypothetical protein